METFVNAHTFQNIMGDNYLSNLYIVTFNTYCCVEMKLPIWISLHMFPLYYRPLGIMVATQVGTMLGFDISNKSKQDPHFSVVVDQN
jgi:hypothetical protein